jgi:hypothetical protein
MVACRSSSSELVIGVSAFGRPGDCTAERMMRGIVVEELVLQLVLLPFRLFWWTFKHDLGLLEEKPARHTGR